MKLSNIATTATLGMAVCCCYLDLGFEISNGMQYVCEAHNERETLLSSGPNKSFEYCMDICKILQHTHTVSTLFVS